jgi:hypothetical protein
VGGGDIRAIPLLITDYFKLALIQKPSGFTAGPVLFQEKAYAEEENSVGYSGW